ncbi:ATP-dependent sacrificial sulfur transferase LarE [Methanolobus psychrotolerans]|uniref:ATP-dependent sacrificial sulfur transferase LarE n=1 Tax=Methanolobus psychrotolerans TaxID=1874706 RepID=UPI000B91CFEC|nr:ATP-dependent sacrificial sulfur transferase LarE [Methanolobus psychrotolerans]
MVNEKLELIKQGIYEKGSVLIAFSGGVDSATLASIAYDVLGNNAVAVTVKIHSFPEREMEFARKIAAEIGIEHRVIYLNELSVPLISENSSNRCYHCKKEILKTLKSMKDKLGFNVILEGSNSSDLNSYRPGKRAIDEAGDDVYSPFIEFDVSKGEIRQIAGELGLSVADKHPSPCLASRFPYDDALTEEAIKRVEMAEDYLIKLGFQELRVRDHRGIARIEIPPADMPALLQMRNDVVFYMKGLGFSYITLDMEGFRSGSMDEVL